MFLVRLFCASLLVAPGGGQLPLSPPSYATALSSSSSAAATVNEQRAPAENSDEKKNNDVDCSGGERRALSCYASSVVDHFKVLRLIDATA